MAFRYGATFLFPSFKLERAGNVRPRHRPRRVAKQTVQAVPTPCERNVGFPARLTFGKGDSVYA